MPMLKTDKLIAAPRGTLAETIAYFERFGGVLRWTDFVDYAGEIFRTATRVGVDPSIAIAQASHETDLFRSYWWLTRLNPAGLGITGTPSQDQQSRTFANGIEAARAQLAHLQLYATGNVTFPLVPSDDPRYDAYVSKHGNVAVATTIEGLAGTWASGLTYFDGVCRHGNAIFPVLPMSSDIAIPAIVLHPQAAPIIVNGALWTGTSVVTINNVVFRPQRRMVTVGRSPLYKRKYADTSFPPLTTVPKRATVEVIGWTHGATLDGDNRWWIGADHTRMWVGGTVEKPY